MTAGEVNIADHRTLVLVAAAYVDIAAADGDRHAIGHTDAPGCSSVTDTAIIARTTRGDARIYCDAESLCGQAPGAPTITGLAVGLGLLLYPDAAIDWPASVRTSRREIEARAGQVGRSLSREDVRRLGECVDSGDAALLVAVDDAIADRTRERLSAAFCVGQARVIIDARGFEAELDIARRSDSSAEPEA